MELHQWLITVARMKLWMEVKIQVKFFWVVTPCHKPGKVNLNLHCHENHKSCRGKDCYSLYFSDDEGHTRYFFYHLTLFINECNSMEIPQIFLCTYENCFVNQNMFCVMSLKLTNITQMNNKIAQNLGQSF
jgi:hypothetical protein